MKTIRLVLLLVIALLAPQGTGRAAGEPPDASAQVYLPLILKDWKPVTQIRFINASQDLVLELQVNGVPRVDETAPLLPGDSLTIQLPAGEHSYTVALGRIETGSSAIVYYRWITSFTLEPLETRLEKIETPTMAAVLSGFKGEMVWKVRPVNPSAPDVFCFFDDGSYRMCDNGSCTESGIIEEIDPVTYTRNFVLLDESGTERFRSIYYLYYNPFVEFFTASDLTTAIGIYDRYPNESCPLIPD